MTATTAVRCLDGEDGEEELGRTEASGPVALRMRPFASPVETIFVAVTVTVDAPDDATVIGGTILVYPRVEQYSAKTVLAFSLSSK